jgi:shikimate kinase
MGLILFQRDHCHLCDLALAVLAAARTPDFESVFIDDDAELEQRYGQRVPVLFDQAGGRELDWPFEVDAVRPGVNGIVTNERTIKAVTTTGGGTDGIDAQTTAGSV